MNPVAPVIKIFMQFYFPASGMQRAFFDLVHNGRIQQRARIAEVGAVAFCYFSKDPSHDFSGTCFRQTPYKLVLVRLRDWTIEPGNGGRNPFSDRKSTRLNSS